MASLAAARLADPSLLLFVVPGRADFESFQERPLMRGGRVAGRPTQGVVLVDPELIRSLDVSALRKLRNPMM